MEIRGSVVSVSFISPHPRGGLTNLKRRKKSLTDTVYFSFIFCVFFSVFFRFFHIFFFFPCFGFPRRMGWIAHRQDDGRGRPIICGGSLFDGLLRQQLIDFDNNERATTENGCTPGPFSLKKRGCIAKIPS